MNQQAERRLGTVIGGKWRVDALLGSGSMAAVYAVTHRNGARAALKILHPTLCTDPTVCERFLGEGYLANSVKHSGVVRVLDDGVTDDGCVFLVMDLLEGQTLEAMRQAQDNRIPIIETLDIGDRLLDILSAVHAAGIIHRDLKPQNVFVCNDGTIKLLDFGIARVFDRTAQSKLSMFGLVLGTPSFMSPEQALGTRDKVDARSDIWSIGATLFTALTGETVHLGANVQARLLAAATVKARSISMVMPDLPSSVAAVIDMSLRFRKEDRWQTADAMRRALREARESAGLGAPRTSMRASFDLSLDDATVVDNGPASFERMQTDSGGPGGTFIGIGRGDGNVNSVVGNDGSLPPGAFSVSPSEAPTVVRASPLDQAQLEMSGQLLRPPPVPALLPDGSAAPAVAPLSEGVPFRHTTTSSGVQESSIRAYGGTLRENPSDEIDPALVGARSRGTVVMWLAAAVLAVAAAVGIGFFAVKRGPFATGISDDAMNGGSQPVPSAVSLPTPLPRTMPTTTAPTPVPVAPAETPSPPPAATPARDAAAAPVVRAPSPRPPPVRPPPVRPATVRPKTVNTTPVDTTNEDLPKPVPAPTPEPAPTTEVFGTPD
ncbi:MAG: serine/threonine protein kinase [Polyangiaceae bacterium]|nr:serine/threonine protein kinase [Polyangiaceae bacterium]